MSTNKRYELSSIKAWKDAQTDEIGQFEAIVSVFGNVDLAGDIVAPGAFTKSIEDWKQSGDSVPVIWAHDWNSPFSIVGSVIDMAETEKGLYVRGRLDLDNPTASQVYRLLKNRQVKEFSFAYNIIKEKPGPNGETILEELEVIEVGPCLKGMNPATELLAVKSAPVEETEVEEAVEEEPKSEAPSFDMGALQVLHDAIRGLGVVCNHEEAADEPKVEEPEEVKTDEEVVDDVDYLAIIEELAQEN